MTNPDPQLTERQAAAYVGMTPITLRKFQQAGIGPAFRTINQDAVYSPNGSRFAQSTAARKATTPAVGAKPTYAAFGCTAIRWPRVGRNCQAQPSVTNIVKLVPNSHGLAGFRRWVRDSLFVYEVGLFR